MIPVETIPGMGGEEDKGEWWKGWTQVSYIWYIVRTFVMPQCTPSQHKNKKEVKTNLNR
jgi:hypothetical protein